MVYASLVYCQGKILRVYFTKEVFFPFTVNDFSRQIHEICSYENYLHFPAIIGAFHMFDGHRNKQVIKNLCISLKMLCQVCLAPNPVSNS